MRPRRHVLAVAATTLAVLVGAAPAATATPAATSGAPSVDRWTATADDPFYDPPADLSGAPGDVLRAEESVFHLDPLRLVRAPARSQRLMYVSTAVDGSPTAVTGTLLTPTYDWPGPGPRPLVTYAVGTQGMGDQCAPSRLLAAGSEYEGLFLQGLLARGYQVVVSDYEGLGTPGTHPYANSTALGRNVLDAARAATRVSDDAAPADAPVLVAGYSEGGGAAAGALEQRATYAPEVPVLAGYAGAVPADLTRVAPGLDGSLYSAFLLYAVAGLDATYPDLRIADLLNDEGRERAETADGSCVGDGLVGLAFTDSADLTVDGSPVTDFLARPDIAATLESLRVGQVAPDVPVLVAHSTLDDVLPYAQGRDMARQWCAGGADVTFAPSLVPSHVGGFAASYPKAFAFFEAQVRGVDVPSSCGRF